MKDQVGKTGSGERGTQDVSLTIPAFSLAGSLSPFLMIPTLLPVLVALFAPSDVLDAWGWTRGFVDKIQQIVPFMDMAGHANSTSYAQVALLTHSFTVVAIPVASLVWTIQTIVNYPVLLRQRRVLGRMKLGMHLTLLVVAPRSFWAWFISSSACLAIPLSQRASQREVALVSLSCRSLLSIAPA